MTNQITLRELELQQKTLALEGVGLFHGTSEAFQRFASYAKDTKTFIKNKFNAITTYFSHRGKDNYPMEDIQYYIRFANTRKYAEVTKVSIQVPEGFKGNIAEYGECLRHVLENFSQVFLKEMVVPFDIHIAKLINQPTLIQSQTYTHAIKPKDIEKYRKEIAKFFDGHKKHNTLQLGAVTGRIKDLETLGATGAKIYDLVLSSSLRDVKSHVDALYAKLETLIKLLEDKSNNLNPSGKMVEALSQLVFELAKQAEFYAVVDQLVANFVHCLTVNVSTLRQVVNETK